MGGLIEVRSSPRRQHLPEMSPGLGRYSTAFGGGTYLYRPHRMERSRTSFPGSHIEYWGNKTRMQGRFWWWVQWEE